MDYAIRKAKTPLDFENISYLQKVCLPNDKACDISTGHWWLILKDGEPVGFGGYQHSSQWHRCAYLCRAGVLPEHRGAGLQKRLIRVRCNHASRNNFDWVITDTRQNPASANSLISCGFKTYLPKNPWGYTDATYWRKYVGKE